MHLIEGLVRVSKKEKKIEKKADSLLAIAHSSCSDATISILNNYGNKTIWQVQYDLPNSVQTYKDKAT